MAIRRLFYLILLAAAFALGYDTGWADAERGWTTHTIAPPYPDSVRRHR